MRIRATLTPFLLQSPLLTLSPPARGLLLRRQGLEHELGQLPQLDLALVA